MGWSGGASSPQAGYLALPHVEDKVDSLRLTGKRDIEWGPIAAATFGMNYTKRDKSRTGQEGRLVIKGGNPYGTAAMPGTGTSVAGTTGLPIARGIRAVRWVRSTNWRKKVDADILNKFWSVEESDHRLRHGRPGWQGSA
jgi:iron complex outermembrane receptor protein